MKRRRHYESHLRQQVQLLQSELSEAHSALKSSISKAESAHAELIRADSVAEEMRKQRAWEARSKLLHAERQVALL